MATLPTKENGPEGMSVISNYGWSKYGCRQKRNKARGVHALGLYNLSGKSTPCYLPHSSACPCPVDVRLAVGDPE